MIRITYVESINVYKFSFTLPGMITLRLDVLYWPLKRVWMKKYPQACIFQSRDFFIGLVFRKLVVYGAKESRNRNMRIILVKDRLSHISKSIYVLYRKHSLLLNLPSLDICCFLLEFFTTTCFSHFSESKISMKSAVYLIRSYPFLCVQ